MMVRDSRTKVLVVAFVVLASAIPATLLDTGDAALCEPECDSCHDAHDRVYLAYLDITRFYAPTSLDGTEVKQVEVQLRLHGNVGLGYTTIRYGHLTLSATNKNVGIKEPYQDFISFEPGYKTFYWNVSGRVEGVDTLHVEVYALGVHLAVEFFESADSGTISVTNPVNADPIVSFIQPDGYDDVATTDYTVRLGIDDPNADPMIADFYYDDDRDRTNGQTLIVKGASSPETYLWDTRGLANGWYYVHVDVDDQRGGKDSATSTHPVIVSHGNFVPNTELVTPLEDGIARDPVTTFTWHFEDRDDTSLTYEVWVGRDKNHMELVGTTTDTSFDYTPDDNAKLVWTVIPYDGTVKGWCRNGPRTFTTDIAYPVEVDLVLPPNDGIVAGPDVKLVWYGRDRDFEQVLYNVYIRHQGVTTRVARDWDDPAGPVLVVRGLEAGETYAWWVEGDNAYSPKGVSQVWNFTIAMSGRPVVDLEEESAAGGTVVLNWSPSFEGTFPVRYDVHVIDPEQGDVMLLEGSSATTTTMTDLVEDATYRWYVIPYDEDGNQGVSVPTFRTFVNDNNSPPVVTLTDPYVQVDPGRHTLEWTAWDPDGDAITFDVYMDAWNATTLLATGTSATSLQVQVEADLIYRWRVVPRDATGAGEAASGIVVTDPTGTSVAAVGNLSLPPDGGVAEPPLVNLTWEASDPLGRLVLYDVYVNTSGGDPMAGPPVTVNSTLPWWSLEVESGTTVSWAVTARPVLGVQTLLGTATFTVAIGALDVPTAVLRVGNGTSPVAVDALVTIAFNATGSSFVGGGPLEYWFDYGDGRSSGWQEDPSSEHTYLVEGTYNATLVVRTEDGAVSEPALVRVEVGPGDLGSDEDVPGPGLIVSCLALLVSATASGVHRRRRTRRSPNGGGGG